MKVCMFVDGENFRHSVVKLFPPPQFYQEDYLPKHANWSDLFNWIVSITIDGGERIRTYWYAIEYIDFFPYKLPALTTPEATTQAKNILCKYEPYKKELNALAEVDCHARMVGIIKDLNTESDNAKPIQRMDSYTRRNLLETSSG